jgi:hypothetical protein
MDELTFEQSLDSKRHKELLILLKDVAIKLNNRHNLVEDNTENFKEVIKFIIALIQKIDTSAVLEEIQQLKKQLNNIPNKTSGWTFDIVRDGFGLIEYVDVKPK